MTVGTARLSKHPLKGIRMFGTRIQRLSRGLSDVSDVRDVLGVSGLRLDYLKV